MSGAKKNRVGHRHIRVLAILLRSMLDFEPGPAAALRRRPAVSRWSPSEWRGCPSCAATGLAGGRGPRGCVRCGGAGGWRIDPYDIEERPIAAPPVDLCDPKVPQGVRDEEARRACRELAEMPLPALDQAIVRAQAHSPVLVDVNDDGTLEVAIRQPEERDDPMLLALGRQVRLRTGVPAFQQLEQTMRALRVVAPFQFRALVFGLVLGLEPPERMRRRELVFLLEGLRLLGLALPDEFRAPRWARDQAEAELAAEAEERRRLNGIGRWADPARKTERDQEILRLTGRGMGPTAIAARLGVSRWTVARVLDRRDAA